MQTIKKLIFLLSPHEKKRAVLLLIMILIMALLDTIGIASILPFVAVLTNPDLIETNLLLNKMFFIANIFGIQNEEQFLLSLGILVFVLLILSLSFKTLTTYLQVQFVQMREYSIGRRLIEGYLHQPYSWFLSRNSSELGKNILSEVQQLINDGMFALIELIAKGLVVISIIIVPASQPAGLGLTAGRPAGCQAGRRAREQHRAHRHSICLDRSPGHQRG